MPILPIYGWALANTANIDVTRNGTGDNFCHFNWLADFSIILQKREPHNYLILLYLQLRHTIRSPLYCIFLFLLGI